MKKPIRVVVTVVAIAGTAMLIRSGFLPKPVVVDVAKIGRGSLELALEAEGRTRVRDRYVVSAPVTGRLDRLTLREGDAVVRGAHVGSLRPPMLDQLQRDEQERRIGAAEANVRQAAAFVESARERLAQAERELERVRRLEASGAVPGQDLERNATAVELTRNDLRTCESRSDAAGQELAMARAMRAAYPEYGASSQRVISLRSPVGGRVLHLFETGDRLVAAGTPIVQIGDPRGLELVIDLLSSDAVKVAPGAAVRVDGWGGERTLLARVRYVEPAAFTKISALGVEEQRVNVIATFNDPVAGLGDGFRANARISLWEGDDVLTVPTSALFRKNGTWYAFVRREGKVVRTQVRIGHMNQAAAEVLGGLEAGSEVIVHPSDKVSDGVGIEVTESGEGDD